MVISCYSMGIVDCYNQLFPLNIHNIPYIGKCLQSQIFANRSKIRCEPYKFDFCV